MNCEMKDIVSNYQLVKCVSEFNTDLKVTLQSEENDICIIAYVFRKTKEVQKMQPGDLEQQSLGYQQAEEEQLPEMMQHEEHQQEYVLGGESRIGGLNLVVDPIESPPQPFLGGGVEHFGSDPGLRRRPGDEQYLALPAVVDGDEVEVEQGVAAVVPGESGGQVVVALPGTPHLVHREGQGFVVHELEHDHHSIVVDEIKKTYKVEFNN
ncbi:hypothetical protein DM860_012739 [Cuscuta australis]|uniref:Uncharacterized protein n=1 Tax=Cuscuta australis TaxID=267555 RepID=A0A328DVB5_9ASTE|nr:hypothetical protein DM860_012739 [Cuscuta australis]